MTDSNDFTRGVINARERYAQAWCDATNSGLQAVEFTPDFLRERVHDLLEACERAMLHLPTCTRPDCDCVYCRCRRAKAKARGE